MNEYPKIYFSTFSPANINLRAHENYKSGLSESHFGFRLKKYFHYYLRENVVLNDGRYSPYHPDFVILIEKHNLVFDIEIDEPYVYTSGKPIHFDDSQRNNYFLQNGWHIIRFSEEQAVKFPVLCCKVISEIIYDLTDEHIWIEGFHEMEEIIPLKGWNEQMAKQMAGSSYRNIYLTQLKSIVRNKPAITIFADGIYLNRSVDAAKSFYKDRIYPDKDFSKAAQISLFIEGFYKYLRHFSVEKLNQDKVEVDFLIFISEYHSFYNFAFDEDLLELEEFSFNVYFHRTDRFLWSEIDDFARKTSEHNLLLIADDPAYGLLVETWISENKKVILMKNRGSTSMPVDVQFINIDYPIGLSIGLKSYEL